MEGVGDEVKLGAERMENKIKMNMGRRLSHPLTEYRLRICQLIVEEAICLSLLS